MVTDILGSADRARARAFIAAQGLACEPRLDETAFLRSDEARGGAERLRRNWERHA